VEKNEMFTAITVQRHQLADSLDSLTSEQWDAPSLCAGWRVRDVLGHLVSILELPTSRFVLGSIKARNFNTYADKVARRFGDRDPSGLLASYRSSAGKRFAPPVVGPIAPLTDVFTHTCDIDVAIGRSPQFNPTATRTVLEYVCGGKARGFIPPKRTTGLRFEAVDLGWTLGDGPTISGPAHAILLAVTGRRAGLDHLDGDGLAILDHRLP
jgi:uncharacterized protein (TIGR03083 family)